MGFEEYLARFISSLLYSYSEEEIDKTNVESLSISRNSLSTKLKDIIIYRNSFLQHGLPFFVRFGLISNISMKLSLKEFNQFVISDIFFYLKFIDSQKFPTIEELNEMRDHQLYAHELFKDKISLIMNKYLLSNFNDQVKSIVMNSLVTISKIYFCIELNDSVIGIFIDRISLIGNGIQQNPNAEKNDLINQELKLKMDLSGLKVFMVRKNEQANNLNENPIFDSDDHSSFIQKMKHFFSKTISINDNDNNNNVDSNSTDSDCIIDITEIDGLIVYDTNKKLNISINNKQKVEDVLNLKLWQITSLAKIIPGMIKFYKYFLTKHIKRPSFLLRRSQGGQVLNNANNRGFLVNKTNNTNMNKNEYLANGALQLNNQIDMNNNHNNNDQINMNDNNNQISMNNNNQISMNNNNQINMNNNNQIDMNNKNQINKNNNHNNNDQINLNDNNQIDMNNNNNDSQINNDDDDLRSAWLFVHRCAIELNMDRYMSEKASNPIIGQFIPSFIKRNQYLKIWQSFKNKPFNPTLLYELDHTLTYHQVTLFRYMTETLRKKWSRKPLGRNDVYKALEFVDMDLPNLVMYFLKRSTVSVNFSKIITNLYIYQNYHSNSREDDEKYSKYYLSFSMINPNVSVTTDSFDNVLVNFGFSSFKLRDNKNNQIIESIENGSQGFNFLVTFYSQAYRVHNCIMSKKIKGSNANSILDDLTIMKVSAMISNVIFFASRNEFFNFLKGFDIEKFLSILFPPSNNDSDKSTNDVDVRKSQLELSALFNINQSSPLDSLFEKIDADFVMDSCRLSVEISDPFQLTFVYDKLLIQRQLQQLELENKQLSVNAKSKTTNNVRKIFRKSDLIFDIMNANIIFGNSKIEKVVATEISIHTIFMIKQKKILTFISPLFFQTSWDEIKQFKDVLTELFNSVEQFRLTSTFSSKNFSLNDASIELPECIKQIEISGGIPTITLLLDMPSSKHKLLTFVIDTVKFKGFLDDFELKASVSKITFEDLLEINNVSVDLKKANFVFEKVTFSMLKALSFMPKDLMTILNLTHLKSSFSFLMKTLSVDLSVDFLNEPIDYTVTNFGGYSDPMQGGKIFLKAYVNCINLSHKALVKNQEVSGTIDLDRSINIFVDFGDLELIFLHEIFELAFNQEWHNKDVFPADFVLDWQIKADSLLIDELFYAENASLYLQMSDVAFGGDVMIGSIEIVYMKVDKKDPISISFDLTRHYFSAALNFDYIEIDLFRVSSLIQFFLHFPFHITHPLVLDVRVLPMTVGIVFDQTGKSAIHPTLSIYETIDDESANNSINSNNNNSNSNDDNNDLSLSRKDEMIFVNLRTALYFDGFKVSVSMKTNDFEVYFGDEKIVSIPDIEVFGDNQWQMNIPLIDVAFPSFQVISKLLKTVSSIPRLSFEMWNIQHTLIDILTSFKIGVIRCLFNNSIQFNIHQILARFLNYELNLKCSLTMNLYSTWFACSELMRIDEIKFQCLINNSINSIAAKSLINSPVQIKLDTNSINCMKNFLIHNSKSSNPFLTIINKTNHSFKTKFGEVQSQSTFTFSEYFDDDEFELSFSQGTIPIKGENFNNKGEMKVILEKDENELVLYLNELNQLKIMYAFTVVNKTGTSFKIEYKNKKHQLKSKAVLHNIQTISGDFKLNGQLIDYSKESCLFNNIYLVKITKRSIVIKPEYFIINECLFDIHINKIQYKRYSKSELTVNIFNNPLATIESIVFPLQQIDFKELKTKKFCSFKLKSVYDFDLDFVLRVQVIEKSGNSPKLLVLSPSVIIKSKIQNLLVSHDKLNCFPLSNNNDFAFSPHKKFISRVFLTTSENFGFCEVILNENERRKGKDELIVLDSIKDPRIVYPLVIERKIKKYPYYNIEIIKVTPYVKIKNDTGFNLMIYLPNSKSVIVEKEKTKELDEFESSLNFTFSIEETVGSKKIKSQFSKQQLFNNFAFNSKVLNNESRPFLLNFSRIRSQKVISTGSFMPIDIFVNSRGGFSSKTIIFSVAKAFPCRIINLSQYSLRIENREFKPKTAYFYAPSHKYPPVNDPSPTSKLNVRNNTITFASNPFIVNKIGVQAISYDALAPSKEAGERNGEGESDGDADVEGIGHRGEIFYYEEHKVKAGSMVREIVVSDSDEEIERYKFGLMKKKDDGGDENRGNFENEERLFAFTFEAFVNDVSVSVFDGNPYMNILLRMKSFRFLVGQSSPNNDIMLSADGDGDGYVKNQLFLSLGNLEIRDFNRQLILGTREKREFIKLCGKNAFSPFHIQEISFSIKPFYFGFNLSLFTYLISALSSNSNRTVFNEDENNLDEIQTALMTILDDGLIEKVKVDPMSILFAFEVGQNISPDFSQLLRIIPSSKPFHFTIEKGEFENICLQNKSILSLRHVESEVNTKSGMAKFMVKNASKFVFSLKIFGSPYSLFESLFFKKFNAFSIFTFFFDFLANISDYIRSVCHFFSGQKNLRLKDPNAPLVWGFTSMFMCMFNGAGIFLHCLIKDKNPIAAVWKLLFSGAGGICDAFCGIFMFMKSIFEDDFDIEKELQLDD